MTRALARDSRFLALTPNDGRPNEKKSTTHTGRAAFEPLLPSALHDVQIEIEWVS